MTNVALFVRLEAKKGKEMEVEKFFAQWFISGRE